MYKRIAFILIIMYVIFFSGCDKQESNITDKNSENNNLELGNDSPDAINKNTKGHISLEMVVPYYGVSNTPLATNDTGCYEIFLNNDWSANILYTDIQTKQRIYLSSDLSSNHYSEDDTSWIKNIEGGCSIFTAYDNIYLNLYGTDDKPGCLYKADANGQNRTKLLDFDKYSAITGAVASDGDYLYTISTGSDRNKYIIRINIANGDIEELLELPESRAFLNSAFDDCIIIKMISDQKSTDLENPIEMYKNQVHKVYKYSLTDNSFSEIYQWKQDLLMESYAHKNLYCFDVSGDCLIMINMENGEQKMLIPSLSNAGIDSGELMSVLYVYDNHILFEMFDDSLYAIDLDSCNLIKIESLQDSYSNPYIIGEYGTDFLVTVGNLEVPMDDTAPDGSPIITNVIMDNLAVIDKDDYWNSIHNFENIKNVFLED